MNIRSLPNKHDLLRHCLNDCSNNLHVLGLSETWLTQQIPDSFININEYVCIRNDRNWGKPGNPGQIKKGGGVCLYLNENLNWSSLSYQAYNRSDNDIEIQWVEIINDKCKNFLIVNGYRPPDGSIPNFLEYIELSLSSIDLTKCDIFLMGDYNIDFLDKKHEATKKGYL